MVSFFLERFARIYQWDQVSVEISFLKRFLAMNSMFLIIIGLFRLSMSSWLNWECGVFEKLVHFISIVRFVCVELFVVIISLMNVHSSWNDIPLSFLILVTCAFLPFFLLLLLDVYQFYLPFQRAIFWFPWFSLLFFCLQFHCSPLVFCYFLPSACSGLILLFLF